MGEGSISPEINTEVKTPVLISPEAVKRLNGEGVRYGWEPLRIVDEGRIAIARMPEGKSGIVIGSGPNTPEWKTRGWRTLDIDPQAGADMTLDANQLETMVPADSQDFLLSEYLTFDQLGKEGVTPARLLQQANRILKIGGELIIESVSFENLPESTIPNRLEFAELMAKHGYDTVVEVGEYYHFGEDKKEQRVVYYGKKVASGFDGARAGSTKKETLIYDPNTGKPL